MLLKFQNGLKEATKTGASFRPKIRGLHLCVVAHAEFHVQELSGSEYEKQSPLRIDEIRRCS